MRVNLDSDVTIEEFETDPFESGERVHLLFRSSEGFGQKDRGLEFMGRTQDAMKSYQKEHSIEMVMFPEYYETDMVIVDRLRFANGKL